MITAKEARRIADESGGKIDISNTLNELDKAIRGASAKGLRHVSVMKTVKQIAGECGVELTKEMIPLVMDKVRKSLEEFEYYVKIVGPIGSSSISVTEYYCLIYIDWSAGGPDDFAGSGDPQSDNSTAK